MSPTAGDNPEKESDDKKPPQSSSKSSFDGVTPVIRLSASIELESKLSDEAASPTTLASSTKKRKRESKPIEEIEVDVTAPEPPSKKALRRAKKGKPVSTTTSKKGGARSSDVDSDEKKTKRSDHGIWIGNLPFSFTKADLRKFLAESSSIKDDQITRVHLPSPNGSGAAQSARGSKPHNKGFAYIDLSTESALNEALALSETLVSGRRVLIKNAKSFEGRPENPNDTTPVSRSGMAKSGKPSSKKIFVGNLSFDTTEEDLREHFGRCGEVNSVFVATFEDSGKCKGFALVEFEDLEAAEAALRGWVKVPLEEEDADENREAIQESDGGKENEKRGNGMRKWWVNRIRGRALRMEFAEDKVVRYKKRYGKGGTARVTTTIRADAAAPELTEVDGDPTTADTSGLSRPPPEKDFTRKRGPERFIRTPRKVDARMIKPGLALANAQRMTGGIVESKGKKITFDD
ncbi:MAG: hypothetical protein M1813_006096 [Trichoglossum hirsutum]|jgi:RNA recognition motif-containing protein|nr:MAG: hypothetical protein M1813_006096 [Trichoglossum hirsutum]